MGGFAIRAAGYIRSTIDVDVIVAADLVFLRHWFSQHGEEPPTL